METQTLYMVPLHLAGYPVFQKLQKWKRDRSPRAVAERRSWVVNSYEYDYIRCTLNWRFGDGQMANVIYTAESAEEAVSVSLEQFRKWEEDYYASTSPTQ